MQTDAAQALAALFATTCALVAIFAGTARPRDPRNLPAPSQDVIELLRLGHRIRATRVYRRETSTSLREAWSVITATASAPGSAP